MRSVFDLVTGCEPSLHCRVLSLPSSGHVSRLFADALHPLPLSLPLSSGQWGLLLGGGVEGGVVCSAHLL